MNPTEIRGRFLPSRVYSRWKWTVRLGLLLVPFLIFLSGGLILFLTPNKYRSTTLFSMENAPPPREIVELVHSRGVLGRVVDQLELAKRLDVDKETAMRTVAKSTSVDIVPDTKMITLAVTLINKVDARDIAEEIPRAVKTHLSEITQRNLSEQTRGFDKLIQDASDEAEEKAAKLANLENVHGSDPDKAGFQTTLERARRTSLLADAEIERLRALRMERITQCRSEEPALNIHTPPVISDSPNEPKTGEELNQLTVRSLVFGLLAALLLPYLMELAFPPPWKPVPQPHPVIDL